MSNTFIIEGNTYPALQSHQMHDAMYELPVSTFHSMDTVPIEIMPQLQPLPAQLTLLHDNSALIIGEYPIDANSALVAEQQTYSTQFNEIPMLSEHVFTENFLTYDIPTNVQNNTAQDSLNTQNNWFKKSPNAYRCKQETLPMGCCPANLKVVKRSRNDKAARTIPFAKRKSTTSVVPIAPTIVGHTNNIYTMCNESQFCYSNSSIVPLFEEDCRTVFKVVHPDKTNRFLFQELSQNRPNTIGTNMSNNTAPNSIEQELGKTKRNTANLLPGSPEPCENFSSKHAESPKQLQTRYGRVCKTPKMKNYAYSSKFPFGHNPQPTAKDPRMYGDSLQFQNESNEDKENPRLTGCEPRKRNIPAKFRCGTCQKTYLGARMTRHLDSNPDHVPLDELEQDTRESVLKPKPTMDNESLCTSSASAPEAPSESSSQLYRCCHNQQPTAEMGTTAKDHIMYGDSLQFQNESNDDKENPRLTGCEPRKRNIQAKFRCGTCHKTYLGPLMTRHLKSNPDHVPLDVLEQDIKESVQKPKPTMDNESASATEAPSESSPQLYRCLVNLVTTNEPESKRCDILVNEISQFVGLVRTHLPRLIVPSEQEDNEAVYVDQNVADVLQLSRGSYRFRLDAFIQERKRLGGDAVVCENDAATQTTECMKCDDVTNNNCAQGEDKFHSPPTSYVQEIGDSDREEQLGVLNHLPLPEDDEIINIKTPELLCEGSTAFGRPCYLSEELLLNQFHELQAIEELSDLSELCSPQVLGVPEGASTSESPLNLCDLHYVA